MKKLLLLSAVLLTAGIAAESKNPASKTPSANPETASSVSGNSSPSPEMSAQSNDDLVKSISQGDLGGVKRALKNGANVNLKIKDVTPLMMAAGKGSKEIIDILIENKADPSQKGEHGKTAFTVAVRRGKHAAAKTLLEKGSDINTKDDKGVTSLMWAAYEEREDMVKFLLENKADVNAVNIRGKTAMMYAKERNNKKIEKLLKEAGAE